MYHRRLRQQSRFQISIEWGFQGEEEATTNKCDAIEMKDWSVGVLKNIRNDIREEKEAEVGRKQLSVMKRDIALD